MELFHLNDSEEYCNVSGLVYLLRKFVRKWWEVERDWWNGTNAEEEMRKCAHFKCPIHCVILIFSISWDDKFNSSFALIEIYKSSEENNNCGWQSNFSNQPQSHFYKPPLETICPNHFAPSGSVARVGRWGMWVTEIATPRDTQTRHKMI